MPADCTTSSGNPQTNQNTSLPTSTATVVPASPVTWSVTCASASNHSFSVTASAAIDQLHVADPNGANNGASGSASTNITGTSDIKVNGVAVSSPPSSTAGSAFNVTASASLHNNGTFGPTNVDASLSISMPPDCTTSSANPQTVQDTSLPLSTPTTTSSVVVHRTPSAAVLGDGTASIDQPTNDSAGPTTVPAARRRRTLDQLPTSDNDRVGGRAVSRNAGAAFA
jgi:hypothetical protein